MSPAPPAKPHGGRSEGYILASRDLIVNDMEIAVEGAQLDGMICLSSCDKTPPAHLMAAGRFNIPTILVIGGYQRSGEYQGKHVDIEDVFLGSVQAAYGKLTRETVIGMSNNAIAMGTAAHALDLAGAGSVHDIDLPKLQHRLRDNLERQD